MLRDAVIANKLYAKMTLADEAPDKIAIKVLQQDAPNFLLPMKCINIDGEMELRFEIVDGTRVTYFNEKMQKKNFAGLLKSMLLPYRECADWFLDYHNLVLDPNYIVLKRSDYTVRYLYVPQQEPLQNEAQIMKFFEDLIVRTELTDDQAYTMRMLRVLKESNANLMGLLDAIVQEEKSEMNHKQMVEKNGRLSIKKENAAEESEKKNGQRSGMKPEEVEKEEKQSGFSGKKAEEFGKKDVQGNLLGNLFGEMEEEEKKPKKEKKEKKETKVVKEGGRLFGGLLGRKKENEKDESLDGVTEPNREVKRIFGKEKKLIPQDNRQDFYWENEKTMADDDFKQKQENNQFLLQLEDAAGYTLPHTIELDLSKGYMTIGRYDKGGNAQCDFNFSASMSFISRSHLRIEKIEDQLYVIDMGSSNGTFVNGSQIVANMAYPLQRGDTIMFSMKHRASYRLC